MSDQAEGVSLPEPTEAASAPESGGGDPFGIGVEQASASPAATTQESETSPQAEPEVSAEEDIDPKYRGKSPQDLIKMHLEAEKAMHQRAQEAAEYRKMVEAMQSLAQQIPQTQQPQQAQDSQKKQYFHEMPYEQQREAAQAFAQQFGENPLDAVYLLGLNMPYTLDQHLQHSDVLNQMLDARMQQYFGSELQRRQSTEMHFADHVRKFSEAHPDFQSYQQDVAQFLQFAQGNGIIGNLVQNGIDPLDFAYNYIRGYKSPQLQQQAAEATKQTLEAQAKERSSGFQLGQKPNPKPAPEYDPFGILGK